MEKINDAGAEAPEKSNSESKQAVSHSAHAGWVGLAVVVIILASLFGAVFGFMAGTASQFVSTKISQKIAKIFPGANLGGLRGGVVLPPSPERIVAEDSVITDMVEKTSPAVVSIVITKDVPRYRNSFDPFGFFSVPTQGNQGTVKKQIGGGSGFLVREDGMILTNRHVVVDPDAEYTVITSDQKEHPAKVLGLDPVVDVAVIKIEGNGYSTLDLGDSDNLKVGQTVVAIGNSLGEFSNTVSKGIVSGLQRTLVAGSGLGDQERLANIIQTDAAINPGNSGGPLLDINGNVIGINVAVAEGAQNVGFAVPINQAKRAVQQVTTSGKISIPFLGVRYVPIDADLKARYNLSFDYGVLVLRGQQMTDLAVLPGSPADKAGIMENDIILEIDGQKIDLDHQLGDIIAGKNVGDVVTLTISHRGETKQIQVVLDARK